tara:strand:+ start:218 stop:385 length:168 start_codon:yes stop_codon:yes gene_type:complete
VSVLLNHSIPLAPEQYEPEAFSLILSDIERALTKIDFPAVVSGEDDTNGMNWFMS